jgi:hypothetical protein
MTNELELQRALGRVEAKLDAICAKLTKSMEEAEENARDANTRISSLERSRAWISGAMGVIGAVFTLIWNKW